MKILFVSTADIKGGAAIAAYRLHTALLSENINSQMLVQSKSSDDYTVIGPKSILEKELARIRNLIDCLPVKLYKNTTKTLFSTNYSLCSNVVDKIHKINPDIVHLEWVCAGMLRIEDLKKIQVPIVWSLHDMWAFTGGCHYDEECGAYKEICGHCKVLGSNKDNDLSRKVYLRKLKTFSKINNITIVGISKWIADCARESSLFKDKRVINIPNPINTNIFKPVDKDTAREMLSLPKDKKLVLYGAIGATSDPRKGFIELAEAINKIKDNSIEFIVFGSSEPKSSVKLKHKTHYMGQLHDSTSLQVLYSAADVMVVPSIQENLSNAIMESLSCGTAVVAFRIGGNSDMISHKENGYLAKPFDTSDLANGIEWVINNKEYSTLAINARDKVLKDCDSPVVAKQFIKLYKDILQNKQGNIATNPA